MSALDEHVDFNHWCVLYRNSADGQIIRPYEYVCIQFLFGELTGESAVLQEYDLDDPDCDSAIVDTPHRFANQINNINLLPSTTSADEDGLASLFSLWGDENPMHSSLDDFEHGNVHCPIAAGSTCEANNNSNAGFDEDDEFAAAVHDANAKTGFPSVQPLSGEECDASTSLNYAWPQKVPQSCSIWVSISVSTNVS